MSYKEREGEREREEKGISESSFGVMLIVYFLDAFLSLIQFHI